MQRWRKGRARRRPTLTLGAAKETILLSRLRRCFMPSVQAHSADNLHPQFGALKRTAILLYGTVVYLFFFTTFVYFIGFVGNFFVPVSVDVGPRVPVGQAVAIDVLLVVLFAVQHTIMARTGFKLWVTKLIPQPAERSTFVLSATIVLFLVMSLWKPIPAVLWDVSGTTLGSLLIGLSLLGWSLLLWSTFLINHFDLFGLRQVVLCFQRKEYESVKFGKPILYRYVRHPMYVGLFIALWATPTMTIGHLVLAASMTLYTLIGIRFEERSLERLLGDDYREYQRQVSMIIPRLPKK
jgi:protein-S-isoprenylcysteine O-methyltransferase Ste14